MTAFTINGKAVDVSASADTPLLWVIREQVGLTGTKYGCGVAQCGCCTVLVDGKATRACVTTMRTVANKSVTTIEGLAVEGQLHPLQEAFWNKHGLQCGFCTPGMIMASHELLRTNPAPTDEEIRHGLAGNICRCTGYQNIVKAVRAAATEMAK